MSLTRVSTVNHMPSQSMNISRGVLFKNNTPMKTEALWCGG